MDFETFTDFENVWRRFETMCIEEGGFEDFATILIQVTVGQFLVLGVVVVVLVLVVLLLFLFVGRVAGMLDFYAHSHFDERRKFGGDKTNQNNCTWETICTITKSYRKN